MSEIKRQYGSLITISLLAVLLVITGLTVQGEDQEANQETGESISILIIDQTSSFATSLQTELLAQNLTDQLDSKSDRLTRLPHRETVRKLLTKQSAETLIKQKEYGAAIKLLESELIPGRENLVILLNYGRHRLYFNFDEARRALSKLEEGLNFQEENEISKMFSMKVDDLRGKLIELGWSTLIKLDREEYVDFVGRLFRFQEALAEYVFQTKTGAEVDWESRSAGNQAFREAVRKDEELVKKIRQELKDDPGESLEGLKINTTVLHVCFRHFVERDGRRWGPLWNIYKKTRRIVDNLRHYTIIAHGFQGISREKIEKELESDTLEEFRLEIERAVELVAGQQVENPFNRINSISKKWLQKL
ncbi:MAG: hypothetical protein ACOC6I_00765 [Candidatus Bipolaricaulota bacterium]